MIRIYLKKIRYLLEALVTILGIYFFKFIGPKFGPYISGFISLRVGSLHSTNKLAIDNLSRAMPELSLKKKKNIIKKMWINLGRIIGEFIHISSKETDFVVKKYVIVDKKNIDNIDFIKNLALKNNVGGIIFSAHIGNWEIGPRTLEYYGLKVRTLYRPLNNPYIEKITAGMRRSRLIEKSSKGNRQIIEALKNKEFVIILADQKISEGEPIKFFHEDAITTTSLARIALRYNASLIPARCVRIDNKFKFRILIERPMEFSKTNDLNVDIRDLTRKINIKIEEWIREYPEQWFWVHNRWKK